MIPKQIHYIWLSGNEKSDLIKKCINSWAEKCPDYKIVEWTEKSLDRISNKYYKQALASEKWAFATDYARLWIIYNCGGIYLDTDVELLENLDSLIGHKFFLCSETEDKINTGLGFGAVRKNEIIKILLDSYENINFKIGNKQDFTPCPDRNTKDLCGALKIDNSFKETVYLNGGVLLPKDYFCPLDYETKKMHMTDNTLAIHWYSGSWLTGRQKLKKNVLVIARNILGKKIYNNIKRIAKK